MSTRFYTDTDMENHRAKRHFASRGQAEKSLEFLKFNIARGEAVSSNGKTLHAYVCPVCQKWLIGSTQ